ncbi:hypothetical protein D3C79_886220 [compost metagenome]
MAETAKEIALERGQSDIAQAQALQVPEVKTWRQHGQIPYRVIAHHQRFHPARAVEVRLPCLADQLPDTLAAMVVFSRGLPPPGTQAEVEPLYLPGQFTERRPDRPPRPLRQLQGQPHHVLCWAVREQLVQPGANGLAGLQVRRGDNLAA